MSSFQRSALHLLGNIYHGEKGAVERRQKVGGGGVADDSICTEWAGSCEMMGKYCKK